MSPPSNVRCVDRSLCTALRAVLTLQGEDSIECIEAQYIHYRLMYDLIHYERSLLLGHSVGRRN